MLYQDVHFNPTAMGEPNGKASDSGFKGPELEPPFAAGCVFEKDLLASHGTGKMAQSPHH